MKYGKQRNDLRRFRCGQCGKTYTEDHTRLFGNMIVPEDKALLAIQLLLEGTSVRSAERISGLHRDTILRLLEVAGERCAKLMDEKMRGLRCERIQGDELWVLRGHEAAQRQAGGFAGTRRCLGVRRTGRRLETDSRLHTVGKRNRETTYAFLSTLRSRIAEQHRFQLTTDGFAFYRKGVEDVFAGQADFAQLIKLYGDHGQHDAAGRYSPAPMIETIIKIRDGRPDSRHISTSFVERSNLSIRMALRRFTRLTNGYSKKLDNLKAACALYFAYYNFCRVHQSIRVSPAVEAGIADHIWTLRELLTR